jgi:hypothetical protein
MGQLIKYYINCLRISIGKLSGGRYQTDLYCKRQLFKKINPLKAQCLLYVQLALTLKIFPYFPLYSFKYNQLTGFVTEKQYVFCDVGTISLIFLR